MNWHPEWARMDAPGGPFEPALSAERALQLDHEAATVRLGEVMTRAEQMQAKLDNDVSRDGINHADMLATVIEAALKAIEGNRT